MTESVPAAVRHKALVLGRSLGREVNPVWEADSQTWAFLLVERTDCTKELHAAMDLKKCDWTGHNINIAIRYAQAKKTHGLHSWEPIACTVQLDDGPVEMVPSGLIASLLAKPTNPEGNGPVAGAAGVVKNQALESKKNTVIRV